MPKTSAVQAHRSVAADIDTYPQDLQPALQEALSVLADIDCRYEQQIEQLQHWNGPEAMKERLAEQMEQRHRYEREPYVRLLSELHQRMMSQMGYRWLQ